MWYAGVANLVFCYINIIMYNINGGLMFTLFSACMSLTAAIGMFMLIRHRTQIMLWDKLSRKAVDDCSEDSCTTAPGSPGVGII